MTEIELSAPLDMAESAPDLTDTILRPTPDFEHDAHQAMLIAAPVETVLQRVHVIGNRDNRYGGIYAQDCDGFIAQQVWVEDLGRDGIEVNGGIDPVLQDITVQRAHRGLRFVEGSNGRGAIGARLSGIRVRDSLGPAISRNTPLNPDPNAPESLWTRGGWVGANAMSMACVVDLRLDGFEFIGEFRPANVKVARKSKGVVLANGICGSVQVSNDSDAYLKNVEFTHRATRYRWPEPKEDNLYISDGGVATLRDCVFVNWPTTRMAITVQATAEADVRDCHFHGFPKDRVVQVIGDGKLNASFWERNSFS